jgi:transcriptional regulator with XRE-family HTH domain
LFAHSGRVGSGVVVAVPTGTVDQSGPTLRRQNEEGMCAMPVLRQVVGETLRGLRLRQRRTLREISSSARVSLGYLSEVERGQKEASSELLAAICGALEVELSDLFAEVSQNLRREEKLALAGSRVHVVPNASRVAAAPAPAPQTGASPVASAQVRALPTVAA